MDIRLSGEPNELDKMIRLLKYNLDIKSVSKPYSNSRGSITDNTQRLYIKVNNFRSPDIIDVLVLDLLTLAKKHRLLEKKQDMIGKFHDMAYKLEKYSDIFALYSALRDNMVNDIKIDSEVPF